MRHHPLSPEAFEIEANKSEGQVEIAIDRSATVQCELILTSDWNSKLGALLHKRRLKRQTTCTRCAP